MYIQWHILVIVILQRVLQYVGGLTISTQFEVQRNIEASLVYIAISCAVHKNSNSKIPMGSIEFLNEATTLMDGIVRSSILEQGNKQ